MQAKPVILLLWLKSGGGSFRFRDGKDSAYRLFKKLQLLKDKLKLWNKDISIYLYPYMYTHTYEVDMKTIIRRKKSDIDRLKVRVV